MTMNNVVNDGKTIRLSVEFLAGMTPDKRQELIETELRKGLELSIAAYKAAIAKAKAQ
jgi:hypothetical protein